jgi:hypothetical protein
MQGNLEEQPQKGHVAHTEQGMKLKKTDQTALNYVASNIPVILGQNPPKIHCGGPSVGPGILQPTRVFDSFHIASLVLHGWISFLESIFLNAT